MNAGLAGADEGEEEATPVTSLASEENTLSGGFLGSPGTGKTYKTRPRAVRLCNGFVSGDYVIPRWRYEHLRTAGRTASRMNTCRPVAK